MTTPPNDTQKNGRAAPQKPAEALSHQERVYFEMFRAIELLGRKLEKAEAERFILSQRLADIEHSAERDETTGRLYLPARIETAVPPPAYTAQRFALPAALASLVLALLTLGAVLMQDLSQKPAAQPQLAAIKPQADWRTPLAAPESFAAPFLTEAPAMPQIKATDQAETETAAALQAGADEVQADDFDSHLAQALEGVMGETPAAAVAETLAEVQKPEAPSVATDRALATLPAPVSKEETLPPVPKPQAAAQSPIQESVPLMRDARLPAPLAALEARAFEGIAEAQHDLATIYAEGRRVRQDYARARAWFARAAAAGVANAHYNLGVMSQQGLGTSADPAAAQGHYETAVRLGHPEAMYNLGVMHAEGRGVAKNAALAAAYLKRAANAGMVQAAYNLGILYEGDALGKPDINAAVEWYAVAAGEGNREAALAVRRLTRLQTEAARLQSVAPAAGR